MLNPHIWSYDILSRKHQIGHRCLASYPLLSYSFRFSDSEWRPGSTKTSHCDDQRTRDRLIFKLDDQMMANKIKYRIHKTKLNN